MSKLSVVSCAAWMAASTLLCAAAEPGTQPPTVPATAPATVPAPALATVPATVAATVPATAPATQSSDTPPLASPIPPSLGPSVLPPDARGSLSSQSAVNVSRFQFEGNTRFSSERLQQVVDASLKSRGWPQKRQVSLDDLEEARLALSRFYVDAGYINSGAILPDQSVDRGVITFRIVEGKLSDVNVTFRDSAGKPTDRHLLRSSYVIQRVQFSAGPPLNILRLKDELELLRQDPNIKSINAELKPGATAGEGLLDVQVQESNPFQLGFQFSDRRPPSVGSMALDVRVSDSDVSGHGDLFSVRYDVLSGPIEDLRLSGGRDFSLDYTIPISPTDTTLNINFTRTDTVVLDQTFAALHIASESDSTSITLRQPVYRKPTAEPATAEKAASPSIEFDLFLTGALRDNHTTLLGRPFSFSPGDENGAEHVTAIRFGQELVMRTERDAFSARSTFSLGVPWFDATRQRDDIPSGDFFAWLGQAQYVHLLGKSDIQLVLRGAVQLCDRPLLTLEQFSLGGVETVRGYPENFLVKDEGVAGSIELRIPVWKRSGTDVLTVVPFFDAGYGWNRKPTTSHAETLDAVGVGLIYNPDRHISAQVFYGSALQNHAKGSRDVENLGLHFNVLVLVF